MPSEKSFPPNRPPAVFGFFRPTLAALLTAALLPLLLTACGPAAKTTPPPAPFNPPISLIELGPSPSAAGPAPPEPEANINPANSAKAKASAASYVVRGRRYHILASAEGFKEQGLGTFYANEFHGRRTSSGEKYDKTKLTAAHKTLPMGALVEVKNLENNRIVVVRINDRGPFNDQYVIDVSRAAAEKLGMRQSVKVSLKTVKKK